LRFFQTDASTPSKATGLSIYLSHRRRTEVPFPPAHVSPPFEAFRRVDVNGPMSNSMMIRSSLDPPLLSRFPNVLFPLHPRMRGSLSLMHPIYPSSSLPRGQTSPSVSLSSHRTPLISTNPRCPSGVDSLRRARRALPFPQTELRPAAGDSLTYVGHPFLLDPPPSFLRRGFFKQSKIA